MAAATVAVLATVAAAIALAVADDGQGRRSAAPLSSSTSLSAEATRAPGSPASSAGPVPADRSGLRADGEPLQVAALEPDAVAAGSASPNVLPTDSHESALAPPPRPESERALYEHFAAVAEQPGGKLAELAPSVFAPGHADAERVALLRALWDTGSPEAGTWFAHALRLPPDPDRRVTGHASLPEFALGYLAERGGREPAAVALLADCVPAGDIPLALRRRAATTVAQFGTLPQLQRLAADLVAAGDTELNAAVGAALAGNENAAAAAGYFPAWLAATTTPETGQLPPE